MAEQKETSLSPPLLSGDRLQVTDVYEIATKIGLEFQKIIDEYGSTSVTNIIPMIVGALEQLEKVVEENEQFRVEHCRLAIQSDRLKQEREQRIKILKDRDETNEVLDEKTRQLKQVQESNTQLQEKIKQLEAVLSQQNVTEALEGERNKNNALMSTVEELQSALDRAKEKLQSNNSLLIDKEKQISRLSADIDTLCAQLVNCQKRLPSKVDTLDGRELTVHTEPEPAGEEDSLKQAEERIEVLEHERIQMQQEQMKLKERLEEATKELALAKEATDNVSVSLPVNFGKATKVKPTFYKEDLMCVLEDRDQLAMKVAELEDELKLLTSETKEEPRRSGSFFFSRQPSPPKPSKVKEILESLTVTVNDKAQKTTL